MIKLYYTTKFNFCFIN